jgi:hypothetical protein
MRSADEMYRMEEANDKESWNRFVETSPDTSIFAEFDFGEKLGFRLKRYFILKRQEVKGGVFVVLRPDGRGCLAPDFLIYNSLMFCPLFDMKEVSMKSERFHVTEFAIP